MPDAITIVELKPFARKIRKLLSDDEYQTLRSELKKNPAAGKVIPGLGGIRKLRIAVGGKGKRGGGRVIYFYHIVGAEIYLMACYKKNEQGDISPDGKKQLRNVVKAIKEGTLHG